MSNHLACLRGCGSSSPCPSAVRSRYELTDARIGHALGDLLQLVLVVDPACTCVEDRAAARDAAAHRRVDGGAGMTTLSLGLSPDRRALLARRIRWFVAATITYNVIEAVVPSAPARRRPRRR